jgi:excisionase family DNA binding protein
VKTSEINGFGQNPLRIFDTTVSMNGGISMIHEPENITPEKWVNLEDVAEHLSLSVDTVRVWVRNGKLPVYRAGKRYKFKISEIDEWVRAGKIKG